MPAFLVVYDTSTNPLNSNEWAFPVAECLHIASMALTIGTIALVDLRLLGIGMMRQTSAQLVASTEMWTMGGLVIAISSGMAIFSSDPVTYMRNFPFQFKMAALLVAIVYNYTVHRYVAVRGAGPVVNRLVACLSIGLWLSLVASGVFIAFV